MDQGRQVFTVDLLERYAAKGRGVITCMAAGNDVIVIGTSRGWVIRHDFGLGNSSEIDLTVGRPGDQSIHRVFVDPGGSHCIATVVGPGGAETFYTHAKWNKPRILSKLKGLVVNAVAWNKQQITEVSTKEVILGTENGQLHELYVDEKDKKEKYIKFLYELRELSEAFMGLQMETATIINGTRYYVMAVTPTRLYSFTGFGSLETVFSGYLDRTVHFMELPGDIPNSELHFFIKQRRAVHFAWLSGAGIYHGGLNFGGQQSSSGGNENFIENKALLDYSKLSEGAEVVKPSSMALSEFHFLLLLGNKVKVVNRISENIIEELQFDQTSDSASQGIIGLCSDATAGLFYAYDQNSIFQVSINDEGRDMWKVYLDMNEYAAALANCRDPFQRDQVYLVQAEAAFSSRDYFRAASFYAKINYILSFEEVTLKFITAGEQDALRTFLLRKLDNLEKSDKCQITMISTWATELYLDKINRLLLEDDSASENSNLEYQSIIKEFRAFLSDSKDVLDETTTMKLLESYGRVEELVYFASLEGHYEIVVHHYIQQGESKKALEVLQKPDVPIDLQYKFAPDLIALDAYETVESWMATKNLNPRKLIPAMMRYSSEPHAKNETHEVIKYLEYCVHRLHNEDPGVHNLLLSLYAKQEDDSSLLRFLQCKFGKGPENGPEFFYDPKYALRLCLKEKRMRACVHIYSMMSMHEEAVALALQVDPELAMAEADKVEDDEDLRKKLWLMIAKHVVEQEKGTKRENIRKAIAFLKETDGLLKIEDILPFFPDFALIDDFKEAICSSLEDYNKQIEQLKEEMNDATRGADVRIGIVAVEISTGDVVYGEFCDGSLRNALEAVVVNLSPAELLLGDPLSKQTEKLLLDFAGPASNVRAERVSRDCFTDGGALSEVMTLYDNMNVDGQPDSLQNKNSREHRSQQLVIKEVMNMPDLSVQALALTIRHLKEFGFERILCSGVSLRPFSNNTEMTLSANTLQQLEVLKNNNDGSEIGSLLQIMNHTLTIFGSRLLRQWVSHPLCDRTLISARLHAVSEIAECMGSCNGTNNLGHIEDNPDVVIMQPELANILSLVLTTLGRAPDIQRGITRIFHCTASPSEFVAVIQAIFSAGKQLQQLNIGEGNNNTLRSNLLKRLILTASSDSIIANAAKMLSSLNIDSADQGDLTKLITASEGQFPEVIKARKDFKLAVEQLDSLIDLYRKLLKMKKMEFITVSGTTHLIELSTDVKVPSNWVKVNSTKKTIRYHPPEVVTALDRLSLAKEELGVACRAAWNSFLRDFSKYYAEFQAAVQALAALDCLYSLAILSRNKGYVRPVFVDNQEPVQIQICSGRHPVLEITLQENFVPNDTNLHADGEYCQIVTGPNMGGKSCYVRQVALIAIMAQVGSFVPASSAKLHVLDRIYTRMGASDSIQEGRSTFLEELSETSHILQYCTEHSLVIIDELGRGTSTHDGMAIAHATLHYLLKQKRSMVLFVTHYPKIASLSTEFPGSVAAYHVSHLTSHDASKNSNLDDDITYLYKLAPGVSERSFGFKVAQLALLPSHCISRALVMASKLEALVDSKMHSRSGKELLLDTQVIGQEQEQEQLMAEPHHCLLQEFGIAYKDFYLNLKAAIQDDDCAKSFHLLKHARSIAKRLIGS